MLKEPFCRCPAVSLCLVPRQIRTLPPPQFPSVPGASLVPLPRGLLAAPSLPPNPTFLKVQWNRSLLPEHSASLGKLQGPPSNVMPVRTTVGSELPRGQRQEGKDPHGRGEEQAQSS